MPQLHLHHAGAWALALILAAASSPAGAQRAQPTPGDRATGIVTQSDADDEPDLDDILFTFGAAVSVSPRYSGSDKMGTAIAPAARIVWRGYSISTSSVARASTTASTNRSAEAGLSGPLFRMDRFAFGLGASINRGRNASEQDRAIGLKDLPGTIIGRMRMRYAITPNMTLTALVVGDLLGRQKGLDLPIGIGWHRSLMPGLLLTTDIGATWGSAKSIDNAYGIGPAEHAASGLPLYRPGSGIREVGGSIGLVGEPTEHWVWLARLSLVQLAGPAARSPIVKQRLQPALLIGFGYRFTLH